MFKNSLPLLAQAMYEMPDLMGIDKIVDQLDLKKSYLINGPVGNGKTFLTLKIAKKYIETNTRKVSTGYEDYQGNWTETGTQEIEPEILMVEFQDIVTTARKTYEKDDRSRNLADEQLKKFYNCPFLIIDDFGKCKHTPWLDEFLYDFINHRYLEFKTTVLTSNLAFKSVKETFDPAISSRIKQMCRQIVLPNKTDLRENEEFRDVVEAKVAEIQARQELELEQRHFEEQQRENLATNERQAPTKTFKEWMVEQVESGQGSPFYEKFLNKYKA